MQRLVSFFKNLQPKTRTTVQTCAYGLGAGVIAVAFHYAIHFVAKFGIEKAHEYPLEKFIWVSLATTVGTGLIAGWLLTHFCRDAAGSGIPQLKAAYWKDFGMMTWRQVWVKFVAAALQIGGGASLGREGPSVQIAGGVGSLLAGAFGEAKQRRRAGAITGAAAGLAAAFNTPLAAITFVLEEIVGDLNSRLMGRILLASMIGALVVHGLIGPNPAFMVGRVGEPSWTAYVLVPIVAAIAALVGLLFQAGSLKLRATSRRCWWIPAWMRPAVGALLAWGIGITVFAKTGHMGVFSLGYDDLSDGLLGKLTWQIAGVLLVAKLLATILCYGSGGAGGIFSPTLFFGAMTGLAVGTGLQPILHLRPDGVEMLAVVGMAASMCAVVRAPVTSILIVFEMTHEFAVVPPLMLGALVSHTIAKLMKHNFYDALLEQDGHDVERFAPPLDFRRWQRQPAAVLANERPILITSLEPHALQSVVESHPYDRFPVVIDGKLQGIVTRTEVAAAAHEKRAPTLHDALTCGPNTSLRDIQMRLVESPTMMVVLVTPDHGVKGLFTLHDLLRAQHQLADAPE